MPRLLQFLLDRRRAKRSADEATVTLTFTVTREVEAEPPPDESPRAFLNIWRRGRRRKSDNEIDR